MVGVAVSRGFVPIRGLAYAGFGECMCCMVTHVLYDDSGLGLGLEPFLGLGLGLGQCMGCMMTHHWRLGLVIGLKDGILVVFRACDMNERTRQRTIVADIMLPLVSSNAALYSSVGPIARYIARMSRVVSRPVHACHRQVRGPIGSDGAL